jgi:hypothetical protein
MRGKGRRIVALLERVRLILRSSGSLPFISWKSQLPKKTSYICLCEKIVGSPTSYHSSKRPVSLHPCMRVPKWDADPEYQLSY